MLFRLTTDLATGPPAYIEASSIADAAMVWWKQFGRHLVPQAKDLHIETVSEFPVVREP